MSELEKILSDLKRFNSNESIVKETFKQTKKDLAHLFDEKATVPERFNMEELNKYFLPMFKKLIENRKQDLVQFLYRVDVNESDIGQALSGDDIIVGTKNLVKIILERELKKVIIRKYYSSES